MQVTKDREWYLRRICQDLIAASDTEDTLTSRPRTLSKPNSRSGCFKANLKDASFARKCLILAVAEIAQINSVKNRVGLTNLSGGPVLGKGHTLI